VCFNIRQGDSEKGELLAGLMFHCEMHSLLSCVITCFSCDGACAFDRSIPTRGNLQGNCHDVMRDELGILRNADVIQEVQGL
jgi:hypothetical protein